MPVRTAGPTDGDGPRCRPRSTAIKTTHVARTVPVGASPWHEFFVGRLGYRGGDVGAPESTELLPDPAIQPDAPAAVIKNSYRALMLSLEMHPDRGGDHWNAALVNEAYAVLSNPAKRAEYDLTIDVTRGRGERSGTAPRVASREPSSVHDDDHEDSRPITCVFCGSRRSSGPLSTAMQCPTCRSPLSPAGTARVEASGRRAANRVAVDDEVDYYLTWPQPVPFKGRLVDLSPLGAQVETGAPIRQFRIIKLDGSLVDAVGRIASCRERTGNFTVGVEFYTVHFPPAQGTFVSIDA